ncbi:MAG: hypothetical protein ACRDG3_09665 [Tepidiformaceae bacterium]
MGHRRNRKRDRKNALEAPTGRSGKSSPYDSDWMMLAPDTDSSLFAAFAQSRPQPPVKSCGGCREFVEDQEGGRGTCLHPGSGVLSPWTDTQACQFFAAQRSHSTGRGYAR